jgi:phage terminase small subunit
MATRAETQEKWRTFADAVIMTDKPIEAAKLAGYKGANNVLAATASRLMARDDMKEMIAARRAELKAEGTLPATDLAMVRERIKIETQDKREFLWNLAKECSKTIRSEEVAEHLDEEGTLVRTVVITESVFKPREAIEAIARLNEMDGDIAPPKVPPGQGGGLSIEQLLLSITQNNH